MVDRWLVLRSTTRVQQTKHPCYCGNFTLGRENSMLRLAISGVDQERSYLSAEQSAFAEFREGCLSRDTWTYSWYRLIASRYWENSSTFDRNKNCWSDDADPRTTHSDNQWYLIVRKERSITVSRLRKREFVLSRPLYLSIEPWWHPNNFRIQSSTRTKEGGASIR